VTPDDAAAGAVAEAARALRAGRVVAFPTETFYGLAVPATDAAAVARLVALKGRGPAQAIAVIVDSAAMLDALCAAVPPRARALMDRHWPGPLTLVLPARPELPPPLVGPHGVGVRVSSHPLATALVRACGVPLTATSANRTGAPPARTPDEVRAAFGAAVHLLDGGPTAGGPPSTVAAVVGDEVTIIRRGAVALGDD
jgi:L-threonylcarbamoyladenylate synthase